MSDTKIEWADLTWNPSTGCDMVSPGCDNCYALKMAKRLKGMGSAKYQTDGDPRTSGPGFGIAEHPDTLTTPMSWRKPRKVFVNSMSDLFHNGVSYAHLIEVFATMAATPQHTYQILTKRHGRMRALLIRADFRASVYDSWAGLTKGSGEWLWPLPNVWLGVSVEDQQRADLRIPALLGTPAAVRFLSCEPLLGPVRLCRGCAPDARCAMDARPGGIDWVIVGGESGPGARLMELAWAQDLVDECREGHKAVFVKQLGSVHGPGKGGDMELWPAGLQVREFPTAVAT